MIVVRWALTIIGLLAIAMGILWMAQGAGIFPYPQSSFMINQTPWIIWGGLLALFGLVLTWGAGRILR
ncbi:hypothetical protein GOZ78_00260 [Agrobacterium vitis]|uniref:DUF3955 domain-containing protein n=1 Tax=Agrobacterium vitis TaxID=373 RepID=A0ABD6G9V5_AGRVI|nr:hypothetical protein [Agrobacterium vitis]MUO82189.1 hypothetical protein [Agrobacterium vitis]MUO97467.1 hypothetical protein [Agrobacterium vitis]MUP05627.1 hypothetical protein [Agrobacterium vitis]MUZ85300.1 hypothetical protein [Agrobacterium vitis]MVA08452.1 hypothetical protein [Agrobacterium vitis]